jgi:hypothetical protein
MLRKTATLEELREVRAKLDPAGGEFIRRRIRGSLSSPVVLAGAFQLTTTMGGWLTLFTKAYEAGWLPTVGAEPGGQAVKTDDAKAFAAALAKAEFDGRNMLLLAGMARLLALAGEFKVEKKATPVESRNN